MPKQKADPISERIRETILRADKPYAAICRDLGISDMTLYTWLNRNVYPRTDMLIAFCNYFNVSADWLLGLTKEEVSK